MSEGFIHSVKVPRLYKTVAKVVQNVQENGASLKQLIYQQKHTNVQGVYALAFNTVRHGDQLNQLIRKTQILFKEQRLDPWLTRVLITELIWGKQCLKSESKPIQTVLSYQKELREEMKNITEDVDCPKEQKVGKPRYVRVNTLTMSVDDAITNFQDEGWHFLSGFENYSSFLEIVSNLNEETFLQDFHIPELLIFPNGTAFFNHPGYKSGSIILQDKASCFPAFLLNPPIGSSVLDMCSAPGMKSTHLAAILKNKGKIFSVEMDERRFKTLCDFVEITNASCVETINKDALTVDSTQCPNIEYILVDPSCSGSGMVDREKISGKVEKCAPGRLRSLQSFQVLLLRHALLNFSSAKKVVYSTCSIQPEENEHVIDEILADIGDAYKLISPKELLDGNWINFSSLDYNCKDNCLYARPETDLTNGFFVAVFERNFDVPLPEYKRKLKTKGDNNSGNNFNGKQNEKSNGELRETQENEFDEGENQVEKKENEKKEENEIQENSGETKEWIMTASQKKRMRRRKKLNQRNLENSTGEIQENKLTSNSELENKLVSNTKLEENNFTSNSELVENLTIVSQDSSKERKKKKKKKHQIDECKETENASQEENDSTAKKKKKSKLSTSTENVSQEEEENSSKKKKKSKRKSKENSLFKTEEKEEKENSKTAEIEENSLSENRKKSELVEKHCLDKEVLSQEEVIGKKNKKRKHKETSDISVNMEVNVENENPPTKKKKKKKDKKNC